MLLDPFVIIIENPKVEQIAFSLAAAIYLWTKVDAFMLDGYVYRACCLVESRSKETGSRAPVHVTIVHTYVANQDDDTSMNHSRQRSGVRHCSGRIYAAYSDDTDGTVG